MVVVVVVVVVVVNALLQQRRLGSHCRLATWPRDQHGSVEPFFMSWSLCQISMAR